MKEEKDEVWIGGTKTTSGGAAFMFALMLLIIGAYIFASCAG